MVQQQAAAMKVTTDACLFGAWAAGRIEHNASNCEARRMLDIGTGTGLLTLMVAQKNPAAWIDAVEIDEDAAKEAADNFEVSVWKDKVKVIHTDLLEYESDELYDFIITNPPFFDNDLKSDSAKRNLAMHGNALSLDDLLTSIKRLLRADGQFAILLPAHRFVEFEEKALSIGFYLTEKVLVKQTPKHTGFRTMLLFGFQKVDTLEKQLIIKENDVYTAEFIDLLKDYYLYL
jgi:tRNA1Val (adenine37-N6)-methyltransferase